MYCKKCGSVINQGEIFCGKCGTKNENNMSQMENPVAQMFQSSQMQQSNNINSTQYQTQYMENNNYNQIPKKKKKIWIPILIIIILLIIIVPLVVNYLATYTNYSIANLRFYVDTDWKREGEENFWYNDSETCALHILASEMTESVYEAMKDEIENSYSTTLKGKKFNTHTWEYSNVMYNERKINIYSTTKDGYGYFILYSYEENDEECTKYLEKFENTLNFKE